MDSVILYIITAVIILFSSLVRGSTGFGMAMTSLPLLTLYLPFQDAVVLVVLINLIFSVFYIFRSRGTISLRELILIMAFAITGVSLGVVILKFVNPYFLKSMAGMIIILFGIAYIIGFNLKIRNRYVACSLSSFLGGILAGSVSIGGPAAAIILGGSDLKPKQFRYIMSIFFLVTYAYAAIMHGATGIMNMKIVVLTISVVPFMIAGLLIGEKVISGFDKKWFSRIVLILLLISGSVITIQGLRSLL